MKAHAVIGAGWGDEGKGLAVDVLCASLDGDVVVVRSNGGAQAGHGVHTPDGRHHVFHHVGSGSFSGARTHLSRFFVAHPMVFFQEMEDLKAKGVEPVITMDPRTLITTPWDMAINQSLEYLRGGGRHGSCGLGFGETIERNYRGTPLTFQDLFSQDLDLKLINIKNRWLVDRLRELGLQEQDYPLKNMLEAEGDSTFILKFLEDCERFRDMIKMSPDTDLAKADHVIFEGAQGLRLDMDLGEFPHVTRSLTGLPNMVAIAKEAGIEEIDVTYMTRTYGTRHGAGPMPYEIGMQEPGFAKVVDLTNAPNEWQGSIRYGVLDLDGLKEMISRDLKRAEGQGVSFTAGLGITCIDQLIRPADFMLDGLPLQLEADDVDYVLPRVLGMPLHLASRGPHRDKVSLHMATGEIPEASMS